MQITGASSNNFGCHSFDHKRSKNIRLFQCGSKRRELSEKKSSSKNAKAMPDDDEQSVRASFPSLSPKCCLPVAFDFRRFLTRLFAIALISS
jgi:hypothetical protein